MDAADARQEIEEYWQRVEEWEEKGYMWPWQKYDPSQPRVPAGSPGGGQFGSGGGGGVVSESIVGARGVPKKGVVEDHEAWSEHHDGPALSDKQKEAAAFYQGNGFIPMNGYLRRGEHESQAVKDRIADLDTAMSGAAKLQEPIVVHRGLSRVPEGLKAGAVFQDKGYVSTTTDEWKAKEFMEEADVPVVMRIKVPKGKAVLSMSYATKDPSFGDEQEVLLPRGSKFKVERMDYQPDPDMPSGGYFVAHVKYMGAKK